MAQALAEALRILFLLTGGVYVPIGIFLWVFPGSFADLRLDARSIRDPEKVEEHDRFVGDICFAFGVPLLLIGVFIPDVFLIDWGPLILIACIFLPVLFSWLIYADILEKSGEAEVEEAEAEDERILEGEERGALQD